MCDKISGIFNNLDKLQENQDGTYVGGFTSFTKLNTVGLDGNGDLFTPLNSSCVENTKGSCNDTTNPGTSGKASCVNSVSCVGSSNKSCTNTSCLSLPSEGYSGTSGGNSSF